MSNPYENIIGACQKCGRAMPVCTCSHLPTFEEITKAYKPSEAAMRAAVRSNNGKRAFGSLSDSSVARVIDEEFAPKLKAKDWELAIAIDALKLLRSNAVRMPVMPNRNGIIKMVDDTLKQLGVSLDQESN